MAGRLIRIRAYRGDPKSIAYIVASADPAEAVDLIRAKIAQPDNEVEDLGKVSDSLVRALGIASGEMVPLDGSMQQSSVQMPADAEWKR